MLNEPLCAPSDRIPTADAPKSAIIPPQPDADRDAMAERIHGRMLQAWLDQKYCTDIKTSDKVCDIIARVAYLHADALWRARFKNGA